MRKQIYVIVRMPYLNLSDKEYYTISCGFFGLLLLIANLLGASMHDDQAGVFLNIVDKISASLVPTALIYLLPGFFYLAAVKLYDAK